MAAVVNPDHSSSNLLLALCSKFRISLRSVVSPPVTPPPLSQPLNRTSTQARKPARATEPPRLEESFFLRDPIAVARGLLGQRLVRIVNGQRLAGLIVETEAYLGTRDRASHSFGGRRTRRNEPMYGTGGTVYVFLNYGIHHLLNVVTEQLDQPSAVLIRALEPTEGLATMQLHRGKPMPAKALCSGPGKLGAALAIDLNLNGCSLVDSRELFIEQLRKRACPAQQIVAAPRIGVEYAREWARAPLRFFLAGNPHVSRS